MDFDMGNHGCKGSFIIGTFEYIIKNGGLTSKANYHYTLTQDTSKKWKTTSHAAHIIGFQIVPSYEEALIKSIAKQRVLVAINSNDLDLKFFSSVVCNDQFGAIPDHVVRIVGYGKNSNGTK